MTARNYNVASGVVTTPGDKALYTVPGGYSFIQKFVGVRNNDTVDHVLQLYLYNPDTKATIYIAYQTVTAGQTFTLSVWNVLNQGSYVAVGGGFPNYAYWVSGALLQWPAGGIPTTFQGQAVDVLPPDVTPAASKTLYIPSDPAFIA